MNRIREFFYGKCGFDALNKAIAVTGLIFLFFSSALNMAPLAFGFIACLILFLYRSLSTDLKARGRESAILMKILNAPVLYFRLRLRMIRERETHKYFRCINCGRWLRVPKGKGKGKRKEKRKISVKCSRCGISMVKKV